MEHRNLFRNNTLDMMRKVQSAQTESFTALVRVGDLDPRTDFQNVDLQNIDLRNEDVHEFDFSGSNLHGAMLSDDTRMPPPERMRGVVGDFVNLDRAARVFALLDAKVYYDPDRRFDRVYDALDALHNDTDFSVPEQEALADYFMNHQYPRKLSGEESMIELGRKIYRLIKLRDPTDSRLTDIDYPLQWFDSIRER